MNPNGHKKRPPRNAEPFDSLGETWWLSEVTPALRVEFCRPIRQRARQSLMDDKDTMTAEQYGDERKALQARIDAGAYEWGPPLELGGVGPGEAVSAALDTAEGQVRLLQLLLAEMHGELPLNRVAEIMGGNPEGWQAALRAAMGLPPLPPPSPEETGETTATTATAITPDPASA